MNEDILSALLQAENEYKLIIENAARRGEEYAAGCRQTQSAYIESLNLEWDSFEKSEGEKLKNTLREDEQKMESDAKNLKERLKSGQTAKAGIISERLKEEVLALYGNR